MVMGRLGGMPDDARVVQVMMARTYFRPFAGVTERVTHALPVVGWQHRRVVERFGA